MTRMMPKSRLHQVTLTDSPKDCVGSLPVRPVLLEGELGDDDHVVVPFDERSRALQEVC